MIIIKYNECYDEEAPEAMGALGMDLNLHVPGTGGSN